MTDHAAGVPARDDASAAELQSRVRSTAKSINNSERLIGVLRRARQALPGDSDFGDRLSTSGKGQSAFAGRAISALTEEKPGALREAGLGALQVWQALLETSGRGRGDRELTIVFTDLVGFSDWALSAGDDETLAFLRLVTEAIEPPVSRHGGRVIKRLGDGMMATFADPQSAFDAVVEARDRLSAVVVDGYVAQLRAGMHTGTPRHIGGDYLGVDVNIAARLAEKAGPGELLVSDVTVDALDAEKVNARRRKAFAFMRIKGVPDDLTVYSVTPK
jgi:adenylate cyclase